MCIYKSVRKEKGGGRLQEERKAILSQEENEEEIAMISLKDLKLQVGILSPTIHRTQVLYWNKISLLNEIIMWIYGWGVYVTIGHTEICI